MDELYFFMWYCRFIRGWFSPYHRRMKLVTPLITMQVHSKASGWDWLYKGNTYVKSCQRSLNWLSLSTGLLRILTTLQQKVDTMREEMMGLFHEATVQEWMEEHVHPVMAPLRRITEEIRACVKEMVPWNYILSPANTSLKYEVLAHQLWYLNSKFKNVVTLKL